jgi:hypothetical protein
VAEIVKKLPTGTAVELWFQDEMRVGQKNGLVYQWARKGTRPSQPADQRYENAYLFGAVCPARDTGAALAMPSADTEAMQKHLDEIARNVVTGAHENSSLPSLLLAPCLLRCVQGCSLSE